METLLQVRKEQQPLGPQAAAAQSQCHCHAVLGGDGKRCSEPAKVPGKARNALSVDVAARKQQALAPRTEGLEMIAGLSATGHLINSQDGDLHGLTSSEETFIGTPYPQSPSAAPGQTFPSFFINRNSEPVD